MTNLYEKYVQNEKKRLETNVDIQKEFINQRSYLETTVKGLKDKFKKNLDIHLQVEETYYHDVLTGCFFKRIT